MKIYIAVDMEGISGINCSDYVSRSGCHYQIGQRLLTEDVNAAVQGAFDGGADEVIVADMHSLSGNILVEQLDPRALLMAGTPHQPRFPFLDESVDGVFLVGYHAMAGTMGANLEHTMSSATWFKFTANGVPFGEVEIDAAIAGESGVPVVMVSGDDKLCQEAARMLPGVEAAMVKQGLGRQSALCLSPEYGRQRVYASAKKAVERLKGGEKFSLFKVASPVTVQITYKMVPDADNANVFGTRRVDGYTVEQIVGRMADLYGGIWKDYGIEKKI